MKSLSNVLLSIEETHHIRNIKNIIEESNGTWK